jgi:D-alanine-D-alanine ligase
MKIAVFYNGVSNEKEISIKSGNNIFKALVELGHETTLVNITSEFEWLILGKNYSPIEFKKLGFDLVFNALHGKFGEDGQLQTLLDIIGIKYTGSNAVTSAIAIDKIKTDELLSKVGITSPRSLIVSNIKEIENLQISLPVFVKPNDGGSSIATGKANNSEELKVLIQEGLKFSKNILIQELIEGIEVSSPVIGFGKSSKAMPVGLIKTNHEFFDYEAKYNSTNTQEIFPAPLTQTLYIEIQRQSLLAHTYLGASGISRSDFIITKDNKIMFLEINTSPGMTNQSLCPKSAMAEGISFNELIKQIIETVV